MSYIEVNDIFDELSDENKRLKQCLNVFIKFKTFFDLVFDKLKNNLDLNDSQNFQRLDKEIEDNLKSIYYQSFDSIAIKTEEKPNECLKLQNMTPNKSVKPFKRGLKLSEQKPNSKLDKSEGFCCTFTDCRKILKTKDILRIHLKRHTFDLQFKCDFNGKGCGFSTTKRSELVDHMNAHNGVKGHRCELCGNSFYSQPSLKNHIKLIHNFSDKILICDFDNCNKQFKTELSLKNHQKYQHLTEKKFVCKEPNCGVRAISAAHLRSHHKAVHSIERPFKCLVEGCHKAFKANNLLRHHINSHSSERNYKCEFNECNKAYKNAQDLKKHSIRHSDIIFMCEWPGCEYSTKIKGLLTSHQLVHSCERSFVCEWPQCAKRFKTKTILENHLRIHNNDKRYACSWPGCQYRCTDSGNLSKHRRVHTKN